MAAHWYCLIGQQQYGPFTSEQIQQLVAQGQLQREHYVRTETDSQWTAAGDLPGLFPASQAAPVQSPAPSVTPRPKKKRVAPPGSSATPPAAASSPPPVVPTVRPLRPATPTAAAGRTGPIPAAPAPAAPVGMPIAAMPIAAAPPAAAPVAAAGVPPVAVPATAASATPGARAGGKPAAAARPIPLHPGAPPARSIEPAAPARDEGGTGRRSRSSRQKSQLLVGGLLAAMVLLIVIAVVVMNRGPGKKTTQRPGRATASAQGGGAPSNSNPESDPVAAVAPSKEPDTIADPPQAATTPPKEEIAEAKTKANRLPAVGKWLDATRQKGGLRNVAGIGVGKAWLEEPDGKPTVLNVEVQITNRSRDEPLEFSGWRPDNQPQAESRASLYDEAGVALRTAPERKTPVSPASVRRAARRWINPGESTTEQLAFVFPGDESKLFRLALPYAAIGQTGYLGFELPRQMIKQGTPDAKEAAEPKAAEPASETLLPAGEMVKPKPGEPETIGDLKSEIERSGEAKTEAGKETPEPAADEQPKPEKEPEPEKKPDLRRFIEEEDQKTEPKGPEPPSDGMQEEPKSP